MSKLNKMSQEYADGTAKYIDYYAERKRGFEDGFKTAMEKFSDEYSQSGGLIDPAIWYMEHIREMGD